MKAAVKRREARENAVPQVRVEDVMTPRSLLVTAPTTDVELAKLRAAQNEFDTIPFIGDRDIESYWSARHASVKKIVSWQRVQHDSSLVDALKRLVENGVQFVEYRGFIVGLLDLSDLNRPESRLVFLHPLLVLEQSIALAARQRAVPDTQIEKLLGSAANAAMRRQRKAQNANLHAPLLEFAHFGEALKVARSLNIIITKTGEIERLNDVRNSIFHGSRQPIESNGDGKELLWAFHACGRIQQTVAV